MKAEVLQWDMFPELTGLLLIGCSIEVILILKIQIKYIDTKNDLADILTKGNFTRDEWNHLLTLFIISHFSSTSLHRCNGKNDLNKNQEEERVTAKSRPMMNLTSRMPSVVSSSTSSNPGRTSYGYQDPGKSVASDDSSGRLEKPSPPGYSKEDHVRILVFSRVEKWSCGARSIRET